MAALVCAVAGCGEGPKIREYTVERMDAPATGGETASAEAVPTALWGAFWPHGEQMWTFKLTGAPPDVAALSPALDDFLVGLRFGPDGNPLWELPTGWKQRPGNQFRFATLDVQRDGQTGELAISALPIRSDQPWAEALKTNIDRWRGQLMIPPGENTAVQQQDVKVGDDTVTVLRMAGRQVPGGGMGPMMGGMNAPSVTPRFGPGGGVTPAEAPAAEGPAGAMVPLPAPSGNMPAAARSILYEVPAGWEPGKLNSFRKAAFVVREGDQSVEITVIDLDGRSGSTLENINRWRGQIGLAPVAEDQLKDQLSSLTTGLGEGRLAMLEGAEGQSILGVLVPQGEKTWFVKMQGPTPLVQRERGRFEDFARSLKPAGT